MKTNWDYTSLADAYLKRPGYSAAAIDAALSVMGAVPGKSVCDVGAGVAHLTLMLAERGLRVTAVEPNDAMRANGLKRTGAFENVQWSEGTGECSGQADRAFDLVTFGSSFNVCDRGAAMVETARILKPMGWFSCLWNHRDLEDPIQQTIEGIIRAKVDGYGYGTRREDQRAVIESSGLFGEVVHLDARIVHHQPIDECIEAWRSHATLQRQAGVHFSNVVAAIKDYLGNLGTSSIAVPYTTNVWIARLRT
ncbi:MAG: methyltransferase domain-containing protein [Alphaproteobacteria bacterium]|nr:methyltransferase domain-containing protein [Alphaproteobacteria bacterium]